MWWWPSWISDPHKQRKFVRTMQWLFKYSSILWLEDGNLYLRLRKCRTQFMLPMEKSVTFISACANETIPSINRSFVYKAKDGCHFRIVHNPTGLYIKSLYYTFSLFYCQYNIHGKWISHKHLHSPLKNVSRKKALPPL
jgi:hypothetical protein